LRRSRFARESPAFSHVIREEFIKRISFNSPHTQMQLLIGPTFSASILFGIQQYCGIKICSKPL
jgi:hypothetical protein